MSQGDVTPDIRHGWACPRCGSTGYVVGDILRCGNTGCPDTREFDPATGDLLPEPWRSAPRDGRGQPRG